MSIDSRSAGRALERGRASYANHAWRDAYESLSRADDTSRLEPEDLVLLATSAYMQGLEDEYVRVLERAHRLLGRTAPWTRRTSRLDRGSQATPT